MKYFPVLVSLAFSTWWGYSLYRLLGEPTPLRGVNFGILTVGFVCALWAMTATFGEN